MTPSHITRAFVRTSCTLGIVCYAVLLFSQTLHFFSSHLIVVM